MADVVKVIDAGPGWTRVQTSDGEIVTVEGNRNWRNNNPGNIEYGPFAQSMGAVGTDGRFAVFPSYDAGRSAKENLIFDSPNYRGLTLAEAISRYAPPVENNTQSYINQVSGAAGIPSSTTMASIPPALRPVILDTMQKVEGWREGTRNGVPVPPMDIPNAVATQLDVTPPRLAPNPLTQSNDMRLMRNPAMNPLLAQSRAAPIPAPVEDRVTARNLANTATAERNRVTPASVEDRVTARNRVPLAPTVQQAAKPTPQQINQAARTATLKANQSLVGQERTAPQPQVTQLPRLSVPMAPVGSSNANIASQRAEQLATRAKPVAAIPDRLTPSPAGLPALYGTMTPQQVAQIGVPATPTPVTARPLPLAASTPRTAPVPLSRPVGLGAPTMAAPVLAARQPLPIASMPVQQPLTIRVQGSNTIPYPQQRPEAILAQQRINSGRDAVSQSGDTSVGNQREAAEARASGSGGRNRRY